MPRPLRWIVLALWLPAATLALAAYWMRHPQHFPPMPEALWRRVEAWIAARGVPLCCEGAADVELLVVIVAALVV